MLKFFQQNKLLALTILFTGISLILWSFFYFLPGLRVMTGHYNIPPSNRIIANFILILLAIIFTVYILFFLLLWPHRNCQLNLKTIIILGLIFILVLIFIFPIISSDVLNYPIYTRIFIKYNQNPYLNAPQNFSFDPFYQNYINHNFERFTMPYGPLWLSLSILPAILGGENLTLTYFLFKLLAALFNLGSLILIYKIVAKLRPEWRTIAALLYLFSPFILLQTIIDAHNDIVMVFLVLLAIYCLQKEKYIYSSMFLVGSVLVKFTSVMLIPIFLLYFWPRINKRCWLKIIGANIILITVFSLAYGLVNFKALSNLLGRGEIFDRPSTSIIIFLFNKFINQDGVGMARLGLVQGILLAAFLLIYLITILRRGKQRDRLTSLINQSIFIYIIYFLLACFLFYEWYLLWLLPLLLLVPSPKKILAFIILSILGFLVVFIDFVNISLWALFISLGFFSGQALIKNRNPNLFKKI